MNFNDLSTINKKRCENINGFNHPLDSWRPSQWSNGMAGECGEACNITKKMDRIIDNIQRTSKPNDRSMSNLKEKLMLELGDMIIYADLLAQRCDFKLEDCVKLAFNSKSDEIGFNEKL